MKFLILNGPNLNLLGIREPEIYGTRDYQALVDIIASHASARGVEVSFVQSNHEGALIDAIQQAYFDRLDGIVLNPGGYTHTGIALADAVRAVGIPTVEVHLSDPDQREEFRRRSFVRPVCVATVKGKGFEGYIEALDILIGRCRDDG